MMRQKTFKIDGHKVKLVIQTARVEVWIDGQRFGPGWTREDCHFMRGELWGLVDRMADAAKQRLAIAKGGPEAFKEAFGFDPEYDERALMQRLNPVQEVSPAA
jgi:hypothetical protein